VKDKLKKLIVPLKITGKYAVTKPFTVMYPREPAVVKDRWRGLHALNLKKCIGCGLCEMACPNDCIDYIYPDNVDPRDKKKMTLRRPAIDWGHCIFCGLCVEACPTGAIVHTNRYKILGFSDSRLDLIATPEELSIEERERKKYDDPLKKIRRLLQTDLLETAGGGEWEAIIKKLREKWTNLFYKKLDGEIEEGEWDKKSREIEEIVYKILLQASLP